MNLTECHIFISSEIEMIIFLGDRFSKVLSMVLGYILLVWVTTFELVSTFHDVSRGNQILISKKERLEENYM